MIKLVAFDFDGTLADSVDFCLACFDKVFEKFMGDKAPTREDIYQTFGMNEPGVIRYFMGGFVPEAEEYFYQLHRDLHKEWCSDLYPGCRGLLDFLQSKALPMTILTGRSETTCRISLEVLKLEKYFVDMQNGSPEKNDKASQMLNLLKKFDLQPEEMVYVGDAVSDAEAAQRAGVKCLSAAWAKSARIAELEKINPGLVFTAVADMQKYLAERI
ncbi:MAG: HAD family hydrolase [Lentisphaerae bacterium]|nr:HAD family hydrolase [Lentisphaerota bacterium]